MKFTVFPLCTFYISFPQKCTLTYVAETLHVFIDSSVYYPFHSSPLLNTLFGHLGSDHIFYVVTHFFYFFCILSPKQSLLF
jgi:hypothetical protein